MRTAIVWFRRDLRLTDHEALSAALAHADRVVPLYVHAPDEDGDGRAGGASRWWLHHSLAALDASLQRVGTRLVLRRGPSASALAGVAAATGATDVYVTRLYEPALRARDQAVAAALAERGITLHARPGSLLIEPEAVRTQAGEPFRVFTPFWRACQAAIDAARPPLPAPPALRPVEIAGEPLDALELLPRLRWDGGLAARFTPGEAAAQARLATFVRDDLAGYAEQRDRPDLPATSRLSPHLHFGELSPRQALAAARAAALAPGRAGASRGAESFVREVGWREFARHVLFHFPHTVRAPLNAQFAAFPWREDAAAIEAWQRGRTGIPLVDAGMRELWHTGWMHNRVRMIAASLLTKNLGLDWQLGARWFHDTLVDADLASNTLGWQWTAGCGADAAPYYRVFNPQLQCERFDPERHYLRMWLPELARLPPAWMHRPAEAPAAVRAAAGVEIGRDYPAPIVDLRASRERALADWQSLRATALTSGAGSD